MREHDTTDAWELDALEPRVLQKLIKDNVESYFDAGIERENRAEVKAARAEMKESMTPEWLAETLADGFNG